MKTQFQPILRFGILAAAATLLAACSKERPGGSGGPELPAASIRTATATASPSLRFHEVPGTVVAVERARLAPKVMGTVELVPVALGGKVSKGDLLVKIAAREIEARLEQARAGLNQADRDLQRETALLSKNASTAETVRNLEDRHRQMLAMVSEAETMLGYTRIVAPFDGVVARKLVSEGDLASPGNTVIEVDGRSRLRVEAGVPESFASLPVGTLLPLHVDGVAFAGVLAELSSSAEPMSRTVLAKIDLPNGSPVRPGQYVRVSIPAGEASPVVVPLAAVTRLGQIERVFVIRDGRASLRIVRTGAVGEGGVEITAGLDAGETVATDGAGVLRDGQRVEVRP